MEKKNKEHENRLQFITKSLCKFQYEVCLKCVWTTLGSPGNKNI